MASITIQDVTPAGNQYQVRYLVRASDSERQRQFTTPLPAIQVEGENALSVALSIYEANTDAIDTWVAQNEGIGQIKGQTHDLANIAVEEWTQPEGAHDAYPEDARVRHDGDLWESLQADNVWEPGTNDPPLWEKLT